MRRNLSARGGPFQELKPVSLTLLAPLLARAIATRWPAPILTDWAAVSTAGALDLDPDALRLPRSTIAGACARTAIIDDVVRRLCQSDPRLLLVNLGEGLDNRFGRVDNGLLSCLDIDLPEVIRIRSDLFEETRRRRFIAVDALDPAWMREACADFRTVLLVAEGVLMYLPPADVRTLFARVAGALPGASIVFDSLSPALARFGARFELGPEFGVRYRWGIKDAREIESWGAGYRLMERISVLQMHRKHFGPCVRALTRVFPSTVWSHSVNRLHLGSSKA
jgi:O-methyltransferase involved in polyketide biosynthesis